MNISQWITNHAVRTPHKAALHTPNKSLTYAQMETEIEAIAQMLKGQLGVEHGQRVAFVSDNCAEFLLTLFACARLGAIFVPLNNRLTVPEHLYILQNAEVSVLVLQSTFAALATAVSDAIPHCQQLGLGFAPQAGQQWETALTQAKESNLPASTAETAVLTTPLLIAYTSGTTGYPKGAVHSQDAVQWNAIQNLHLNDLTSMDHILTVLPLFHVGGFNVQTLPGFYCGATVTLQRSFDPEQVLAAITNDKITITHLVPSMMRACILSPQWHTTDFTHLRALLTGTTIIPQDLCDQFRAKGVEVSELYGATETCPIAIYKRPSAPRDKATSIGLPAPHCQVRIVDEDGNNQPVGEAGEIWIKGPNVMLGYWQNKAATQQALTDGWYHTGDVAYRDEDGFFFIRDRKKNMIIKGGENVYPAEIERVLNSHPDIQESAVIGIPDEQWQEIPVAAVVSLTGASLTTRQLRAFLSNKLAGYKIPHHFLFDKPLPKNAMGKLQHFRLREQLLQDEAFMAYVAEAVTAVSVTPTDLREQLAQASAAERPELLQKALREMITAVFNLKDEAATIISPADSFVSLGLNSLTAIELRNQLIETFDVSVPISFFANERKGNIGSLTKYLLGHLADKLDAPSNGSAAPAATPQVNGTTNGQHTSNVQVPQQRVEIEL